MTYIYSRAKNRRSGSTMQKQKARGSAEKFKNARAVIPGYPKTEKFKTEDEIEEYLSGDRITCLLCGKLYVQLGGYHTVRIHNMTAYDYKEMFGIPQKYALTGDGKSDGARKYWSSPEGLAKFAKARSVNKRIRKRKARPLTEASLTKYKEDTSKYGRTGDNNPACKLTNHQIIEIRQSKEKTGALCKKYGVGRSTIKGIRNGTRRRDD